MTTLTLTLTNDDAEWVEALIEQRDAYAQALKDVIKFATEDNKLTAMCALVLAMERAEKALKDNPDPIAPTVA